MVLTLLPIHHVTSMVINTPLQVYLQITTRVLVGMRVVGVITGFDTGMLLLLVFSSIEGVVARTDERVSGCFGEEGD